MSNAMSQMMILGLLLLVGVCFLPGTQPIHFPSMMLLAIVPLAVSLQKNGASDHGSASANAEVGRGDRINACLFFSEHLQVHSFDDGAFGRRQGCILTYRLDHAPNLRAGENSASKVKTVRARRRTTASCGCGSGLKRKNRCR